MDAADANLHGAEAGTADDFGLSAGAQTHRLQALAHDVRCMDAGDECAFTDTEV
jgi:hypothetical protein